MPEHLPRGVNYHTKSRPDINPHHLFYPPHEVILSDQQIKQEMRVIKDELHCDSVRLAGHTSEELIRVGKIAKEVGLTPWYSPRFINATFEKTKIELDSFCKSAVLAGEADSPIIVANELPYDCADNLGKEITRYGERGKYFVDKFLKRGKKVDNTKNVQELIHIARSAGWEGLTTYASLPPHDEVVKWNDILDSKLAVSCNLYWGRNWPLGTAWNDKQYQEMIKKVKHMAGQRPVIITEFGTVPQRGVLKAGGGAYNLEGALDYEAQADAYRSYMPPLQREGVGYFAYAFSEPKPKKVHQSFGLLLRDNVGTATQHTPASQVFASFNETAKQVHGVSLTE